MMIKGYPCRALPVIVFLIILICYSGLCSAAEMTLGWDPNSEQDLQGYYLYYKAGSSVVDDKTGAAIVKIPLTKEGFDPEKPSFSLTDLEDDVEYFIAVSAYNPAGESGFSNEVSAMNGSATTQSGNSSGGGGGGCFLHTAMTD